MPGSARQFVVLRPLISWHSLSSFKENFITATMARIFGEASITVNKIFVDNAKTQEQNPRPLAHEHATYETF
jgi:hypothetical protein